MDMGGVREESEGKESFLSLSWKFLEMMDWNSESIWHLNPVGQLSFMFMLNKQRRLLPHGLIMQSYQILNLLL